MNFDSDLEVGLYGKVFIALLNLYLRIIGNSIEMQHNDPLWAHMLQRATEGEPDVWWYFSSRDAFFKVTYT